MFSIKRHTNIQSFLCSFFGQTHSIHQLFIGGRANVGKNKKYIKVEGDDVLIQGNRSQNVLIIWEPLVRVVRVNENVAIKYNSSKTAIDQMRQLIQWKQNLQQQKKGSNCY